MRYTIVTPTICRPSLARLCESIDGQTYEGWEHLVMVDLPAEQMTTAQNKVLKSLRPSTNRLLLHCDEAHKNYGNSCRHQAWSHVKGEYVLYVDDDDYLADDNVLETLVSVTELWAVFPVHRYGARFLRLPPGKFKTGTGMFIHRKETGRWPDLTSYEADTLFAEELVQKYPYQVLESRPLVVLPRSSCGLPNADTLLGGALATLVSQWFYYRKTERLKRLLFKMPLLGRALSRFASKPVLSDD